MAKIDSLSIEIGEALKTYTKEVEEEIARAADDVSKEAVSELKSTSPRKTGEYAKGWGRKKQKNGYTVYNRKKPELTHLLEKGHAKRGGGRVPGIKHIEPVEEWANKEFEKRVEKVIKG